MDNSCLLYTRRAFARTFLWSKVAPEQCSKGVAATQFKSPFNPLQLTRDRSSGACCHCWLLRCTELLHDESKKQTSASGERRTRTLYRGVDSAFSPSVPSNVPHVPPWSVDVDRAKAVGTIFRIVFEPTVVSRWGRRSDRDSKQMNRGANDDQR